MKGLMVARVPGTKKTPGAGDFLNIMVGSGLKVTASKKQVESMPTVGKSKKRQKQFKQLFNLKNK